MCITGNICVVSCVARYEYSEYRLYMLRMCVSDAFYASGQLFNYFKRTTGENFSFNNTFIQ